MDIDLEKIEDKGVGLIQDMLTHFPLEVKYAPNKGRHVVASRDINAGEVVMRTLPFSASVQDHLKTFVCHNCYKYRPDTKYNLRCVKCNEVWYCSDICFQSMSQDHENYECKYFRRMRGSEDFDTDQWTETRATLTSVTKLANLIWNSSTENRASTSSSTETEQIENIEKSLNELKIADQEGSSSEASTLQTGSQTSETISSSSTLENRTFRSDVPSDYLVLVGNYEYMSEAQKEYMNQIEQVISKVLKRVEQKSFETGIFSKFSTEVILSLMSKQRCNRFGIWSKMDKCLGVAISPASSFFNHSCAPNCIHEQDGREVLIRTLHPVPKGTELCISYIHILQDLEARQEELKCYYLFTCECIRCKDSTDFHDKWVTHFCCANESCNTLLYPSIGPLVEFVPKKSIPKQKKKNKGKQKVRFEEKNVEAPPKDAEVTTSRNNDSGIPFSSNLILKCPTCYRTTPFPFESLAKMFEGWDLLKQTSEDEKKK